MSELGDSYFGADCHVRGAGRARRQRSYLGVRTHTAIVVPACSPLGSVRRLVYRIPSDIAEHVWKYLDHREKDGYTMRHVEVYGLDDDGNETTVEKNVSSGLPFDGALELMHDTRSAASMSARLTIQASVVAWPCEI